MLELTQTQNTFGSFPARSVRLSIRLVSYPCVGKDDGQNKVTIGKETAAARMDSSNHSLHHIAFPCVFEILWRKKTPRKQFLSLSCWGKSLTSSRKLMVYESSLA